MMMNKQTIKLTEHNFINKKFKKVLVIQKKEYLKRRSYFFISFDGRQS